MESASHTAGTPSSSPRTILLVEDDPILGRSLSVDLESEEFKVIWTQDLRSAIAASANRDIALVVLDLGLPDGSGLDFLRRVREKGSILPVVILTAQTSEETIVEAFRAGATDFVRKPFGSRELMARIRAALGDHMRTGRQLRYGEVVLLTEQRRVLIADKEVEFNRREFDVLAHLVRHAESVVTRESLLHQIDKEGEVFDRTIDSHVSHVRGRLKMAGVHSIQISSVYGVGYRLEKR